MFFGLLLTLLPDLSSPDDRSSSFSPFFSFCLSCCSSRNFLLLPEPLGCLELRRFCSLQNCRTAILSPSNGTYVLSTLSSMQGSTVTSICTFEQQNTVVINEIMHYAQNGSLLDSWIVILSGQSRIEEVGELNLPSPFLPLPSIFLPPSHLLPFPPP